MADVIALVREFGSFGVMVYLGVRFVPRMVSALEGIRVTVDAMNRKLETFKGDLP